MSNVNPTFANIINQHFPSLRPAQPRGLVGANIGTAEPRQNNLGFTGDSPTTAAPTFPRLAQTTPAEWDSGDK